jgi:predicted tellurium resistance membrane protein TerC
VGTFAFPPIGGIIAAPLVLFLMEFHRLGDSAEATQVVKALLFGWGLAFVVRFGLGLVMIALWGIWAYLI